MNAREVALLLWKHKKTLAVAESCTGGLISHALTNIAGSSRYFLAGLVVYSNETKSQLLTIPPKEITRFGAVSKQVAALMAKRVRVITRADIGIATSGIAGPTGGSAKKPVGTVYIALSTKHSSEVKRCSFHGSRLNIKNKTTTATLALLRKCLKNP